MSRYLSRIFIILFFGSNSYIALSQENSIFLNDYLDPFISNPACTGSEYYPVLHLSARKQWVGFPESPATLFLSGNTRLGNYDFYDPKGFVNQGPLQLKDRIGLGASIFKDKNGPLATSGGLMSYSYSVPVTKESRLSFGLSVLMLQYSVNTSILKPDQIFDPYLLSGDNRIFKFNCGFGLYYSNSKYFIGTSLLKLFPGISDINDLPKESPDYFMIGGYKFNINGDNMIFEPSVELKKFSQYPLIIDTHAKLYIKKLNWIATTFSSSGNLNVQLGLRFYKMAYIGYGYYYTLGKIARFNYGSHEISLGINLGLFHVEGLKAGNQEL